MVDTISTYGRTLVQSKKEAFGDCINNNSYQGEESLIEFEPIEDPFEEEVSGDEESGSDEESAELKEE